MIDIRSKESTVQNKFRIDSTVIAKSVKPRQVGYSSHFANVVSMLLVSEIYFAMCYILPEF